MSRFRRLSALAVAALVLLPACGSSDSGGGEVETRAFAADNGNITIPVKPEKIVATGYAVPVLIEADAPLVGISGFGRAVPMMTPEDKATYEKLPKIAGDTSTETDYEAIAKLDPDLIIVGVPAPVLKDLDMKRLESIAPVVAAGPQQPSGWRDLSKRHADAAGVLGGFESAKTAYEKKAAELKAKYATALDGVKFGHLGAYGESSAGTYQREFPGSWGTNVATDIGVVYPGEVKEKKGGSQDVSEYPSIEELPKSYGEMDAITYTVDPDGSVPEAVKYVLNSPLWKNLPAVKNDKAIALRYTEAATYTSALKTLDALDKALAPLLEEKN